MGKGEDRKLEPVALTFKTYPWKFERPTTKGPLYAPEVQPLDWSNLSKLALATLPNIGPDVHAVNRFIYDPSAHTVHHDRNIHSSQEDEITISTLLNIKQIQVAHQHLPITTKFFTVNEIRKSKARRRTIFHTIADNALGPHLANMKVASMNLLSARMRPCTHGATRDFKSYFNQLLLSDAVADMYVFANGTTKYRLNRAAMGNSNSPAIASIVTSIIVQLALERHRTQFPQSVIKHDIIIDDVLFASNDEAALAHVLMKFDEICASFNVTISTKTHPAKTFIHRGAEFDLSTKTQRLKQDFVDKMDRRFSDFEAQPDRNKARSLLGSVAYSASIIDLDITPTFKAFANLLSSSSHKMANDIMTSMRESAKIIFENRPKPFDAAAQTPSMGTICSDATPTKVAGFFLSVDDKITTLEHHVSNDIHVNEALSTVMCVELLQVQRIIHTITIVSDNSIEPGRRKGQILANLSQEKCDPDFQVYRISDEPG
jgi:hypothetical protein